MTDLPYDPILRWIVEFVEANSRGPSAMEIHEAIDFRKQWPINRSMAALEAVGRGFAAAYVSRPWDGSAEMIAQTRTAVRATLIDEIVADASKNHGFNDGEEDMIVVSPDELRKMIAKRFP